MPPDAKFVMIAVASAEPDEWDRLYALDETGRVWRYLGGASSTRLSLEDAWEPFPETRLEAGE